MNQLESAISKGKSMTKNTFCSKIARIAAGSAVLGTTAALILVGAPADADVVGSAARGVSITFARGV